MFTRSAAFYDAIYRSQGKDYAAETRRVDEILRAYLERPARTLLDVGCGTGGHLAHFRERYDVAGLDLDEELLEIARRRLPGVPLLRGDMVDFDLGRRFDAVVCLFSAVGYAETKERLFSAVGRMAAHLEPGAVLVVEPWLTPEVFQTGRVHATYVDEPELKVARMNVSRREDDRSVLDFHYLVATPEGAHYFTERHVLGLFPLPTYREAFEAAGLETWLDDEGLQGRGLLVGRRPSTPAAH